jgi:hypothetical protein
MQPRCVAVISSVLVLALGWLACGSRPGSDAAAESDVAPANDSGGLAPTEGARCTSPIPLKVVDLRRETWSVPQGAESSPVCAGGMPKPARFYSATIPPGQEIRIRVMNDNGDAGGPEPVVQLFSSCAQLSCLATGRPDDLGGQELRYVNQGLEEEHVQLAVSSSLPYVLNVMLVDFLTNVRCESARPIEAGTVLPNQDIGEGFPKDGPQACGAGITRSLFYRANVAVNERLMVTVVPRGPARAGQLIPTIGRREDCSGCVTSGSGAGVAVYRNQGQIPKTVIFEVHGLAPAAFGPFDLKVESRWFGEGVVVQAAPNLHTSEAGGAVTFTVALAGPPRAPVTIVVVSSDVKEGVASPSILQFDERTWAEPQTVTVKGVDDDRRDGHRPYRISLGPAQSADLRFGGLDVKPVEVINLDDEPGVSLQVATPLVTSEAGLTVSLLVSLIRAPVAPVQVGFKSSDATEAIVSPDSLVFGPENFSTPQVVTVTGVDDGERDGPVRYRILAEPVTSLDPRYVGAEPQGVEGENWDDDWDAVQPTRISANRPCFGNAIGADLAGGLYVAMNCDPEPGEELDPDLRALRPVFAAASLDGGRTFSAPLSTGMPNAALKVVGTLPGRALLVGQAQAGIFLSRTGDGGRSWSLPERIAAANGELHLAAHGARVVMVARSGADTVTWVSKDGGLSFLPPHAIDGSRSVRAASIDGDGVIWIFLDGNDYLLRKSSDDGATFDAGVLVTTPNFLASSYAFGPKTLFMVSEEDGVFAMKKDDVTSQRRVPGTVGARRQGLVADQADTLILLQYVPGNMLASRLPLGADAFVEPKSLGDFSGFPAGVALSNRAAAVMMSSGDQIFVGVATWP